MSFFIWLQTARFWLSFDWSSFNLREKVKGVESACFPEWNDVLWNLFCRTARRQVSHRVPKTPSPLTFGDGLVKSICRINCTTFLSQICNVLVGFFSGFSAKLCGIFKPHLGHVATPTSWKCETASFGYAWNCADTPKNVTKNGKKHQLHFLSYSLILLIILITRILWMILCWNSIEMLHQMSNGLVSRTEFTFVTVQWRGLVCAFGGEKTAILSRQFTVTCDFIVCLDLLSMFFLRYQCFTFHVR